ncbi:hypothetical protein HMPREF9005_1185 [Actinomyces sp. oral taxon 178 str. F0338]|nr:hypothetical protein HMPREF9005_1185 [Actinomyces sp. oral taxon 178 str. F0338]
MRVGVGDLLGLIPARAGKTSRSGSPTCGAGAHPRACGENAAFADEIPAALGSSPRVRGKPSSSLRAAEAARLIPARAGKTVGVFTVGGAAEAHPRACGENRTPGAGFFRRGGSSPRVRGKLPDDLGRVKLCRLIPARAGKTLHPGGRLPGRAAHPRACGENSRTVDHDGDPDGSSPRVRGKPHPPARGRAPPRLIPARAGKTRARGPGARARAAHPRACGENTWCATWRAGPSGSSPRVRGKRYESRTARALTRLIPARAGKTARGRPA